MRTRWASSAARATALATVTLLLAAGCGGGGDGGATDVLDAAPDAAVDVPIDTPADVPPAPDVPPDVPPAGCPDGTVFVPILDECYPEAGDPDTACAPGDQFVLSFSTDGDFAAPEGAAPVGEWAGFPATVSDVKPGEVEVTGRRQLEGGGQEDVVARFSWSNHPKFGVPWSLGLAVQIEWIGVPNPYNELTPRHGLRVRDSLGRLLFLVDDGKGDLADPIWTLAPEGAGMAGWTVTRELVGCPVSAAPPGRETPALPTALRFSSGEAEAVVLPGAETQLAQGGLTYTVMNALAERRVGDDPAQPERMAWLILGRPPLLTGQAGAICSDALPCDGGLLCASWPGGGRVCLE